jgi:hypothetical protein
MCRCELRVHSIRDPSSNRSAKPGPESIGSQYHCCRCIDGRLSLTRGETRKCLRSNAGGCKLAATGKYISHCSRARLPMQKVMIGWRHTRDGVTALENYSVQRAIVQPPQRRGFRGRIDGPRLGGWALPAMHAFRPFHSFAASFSGRRLRTNRWRLAPRNTPCELSYR